MGARNCPYFSLFLPPNTHKTYGYPGDFTTLKLQQELSEQKGPTHRSHRICRGQLAGVERPPSRKIAQRANIYQALTMCQAHSSSSQQPCEDSTVMWKMRSRQVWSHVQSVQPEDLEVLNYFMSWLPKNL